MNTLKKYAFWFVVGSQDLYGKKTLDQVAEHAKTIVDGFNADPATSPGARMRIPQKAIAG